ncbi:MAG: carbonic anhydrase [Pyrinomonadaceae bacterium]
MKTKQRADAPDTGRRVFLRASVMAGVAAALSSGVGAESLASIVRADGPHGSHQAEALLLTCMDYRLHDETERYMTGRGLRNKYDQIVLAGASLGAVTETRPDWNKTFWDHLALAIELHKIHRVMVMDHRDCGAYKLILGEDFAKDPKKETEAHAVQLRRLGGLIKERHGELEVELLLMSLTGKVERV